MEKAVAARVKTLMGIAREQSQELPPCHAAGTTKEGYDPSEEICQDCGEKYSCLPLAIEHGTLAGDYALDLEVEAVLIAERGKPFRSLLDFVLQRQTQRARLRSGSQPVPHDLTIEAPVRFLRRPFEQLDLIAREDLSGESGALSGGIPSDAQDPAEGTEVPKASKAAARAQQVALPRAKTLPKKAPRQITKAHTMPPEPPWAKGRSRPLVTKTGTHTLRKNDPLPPGRVRKPRMAAEDIQAPDARAIKARIADVLAGHWQEPAPKRKGHRFPLQHMLSPQIMKGTLAGGELGGRVGTRVGSRVGLEVGQTLVRKKLDGRLVAVRFERTGYHLLNTGEMFGSLSSAVQGFEQRRCSGNDYFHFTKHSLVFLFNAKGEIVAHSGMD